MMEHKFKGFSLGIMAAAAYGLNPLFTLPLYDAGLTVDTVLFYRYILAIIILGGFMKARGHSFKISKQHILPLFVLGIMFSFSSLFLFISYNYMDAGIASTILFVYPILVALIMTLFFHERISFITIFAITLAFSGIALLYQGDGEVTLSLMGVFFVFCSSLTYALYIVGVNRSSVAKLPTTTLTFYAILFGSLIYIVRLRFGLDLQLINNPVLWADAFSLALFPTVFSLIAMTASIHYIGSTYAAILGALEPLTALMVGVLVFDERLTPRILVGVALILISVTLIITGRRAMIVARRRIHRLRYPQKR